MHISVNVDAHALAYGPQHEMDYILFIQVPHVTLNPNPEEVEAVRYIANN
jgi:isopentenyldiphosphate isomerase